MYNLNMKTEFSDKDVINAIDGAYVIVMDGKFFDGDGFDDELTVNTMVYGADGAKKALAELAKIYDGDINIMQYRDVNSIDDMQTAKETDVITEAQQMLDATPYLINSFQQIKGAYAQMQTAIQSIDAAINVINTLQTKATKDNVIIDRLGVETNADPTKVVKTMSAHLPDLNNAKVSIKQSMAAITAPTRMASMFV